MRNFLTTLARQPVVQFVVLGALLGGLLYWMTDEDVDSGETTIHITTADLARLEAGWAARWNRPPTPQEFQGLLRADIRERVLFREAVSMGLDRDDQVVRRVLVQKLERIANDLIELSLAPTDQDLEQYYAENAESYRPPTIVSFTHVFIDPDQRGESAVQDAEAIVAELKTLGEEGTAVTERFGDRFLLQSYYPEKTHQRVASLFGTGFADSLFELTPGAWHGPVLSGYGMHAVFVHDLKEFDVPPLDDVREFVRQSWVDEKRSEITETYYNDLLARYEVIIDGQTQEGATATDAAPGS